MKELPKEKKSNENIDCIEIFGYREGISITDLKEAGIMISSNDGQRIIIPKQFIKSAEFCCDENWLEKHEQEQKTKLKERFKKAINNKVFITRYEFEEIVNNILSEEETRKDG